MNQKQIKSLVIAAQNLRKEAGGISDPSNEEDASYYGFLHTRADILEDVTAFMGGKESNIQKWAKGEFDY